MTACALPELRGAARGRLMCARVLWRRRGGGRGTVILKTREGAEEVDQVQSGLSNKKTFKILLKKIYTKHCFLSMLWLSCILKVLCSLIHSHTHSPFTPLARCCRDLNRQHYTIINSRYCSGDNPSNQKQPKRPKIKKLRNSTSFLPLQVKCR